MKAKAKMLVAGLTVLRILLSSHVQLAIAAAGDENWDASFGVPGSDAGVFGMSLVGANLYACGSFTSIGAVSAANFAEWNGQSWSLSDAASSCGCHTVPNGINCTQLAAAVNGGISAIAAVGTNVYVGGNFTTAGGVPALRIAKWDGNAWSSIGDITNGNPYCVDGCYDEGVVFSFAAKGNDLYVGGRFTFAGTVFANNIAKWDGTNWWALGDGLDDQVTTLAISGSDVYATGNFRHAGSLTVNMIARWDGNDWHDLLGGVTDLFSSVNALAVNGNELFAAGGFRTIGGIAANHIAKWDGKSWSLLGSGIGIEGVFGAGVSALTCNGSELFVGGCFPLAGGTPATNIALWHIPHSLSTKLSGSNLTFSWPATGSNFVLEANASLLQTNWTSVSPSPVILGDQLVVTNQISSASRFYRLRRR